MLVVSRRGGDTGTSGPEANRQQERPVQALPLALGRITLRRWLCRYAAEGSYIAFAKQKELIHKLRRERKFAIKRFRNELIHQHGLKLLRDTIYKVFIRQSEDLLKRPKLKREGSKARARPIPHDRVQNDTIASRPYQYTPIDDCTRFQVLRTYPCRNAKSVLDFLKQVVTEMPFATQPIQTDRGQLHLNRKVDGLQRVGREGPCPTIDLNSTAIRDRLAEGHTFYNWQRPHDSLEDKARIGQIPEFIAETPLNAAYAPAKNSSHRLARADQPSRSYDADSRPYAINGCCSGQNK